MQRLGTLVAFSIIAIALVLMAVLSVQNYTQISLKFLFFESVEIPLGILLALSFSLGLIFGVIISFVKSLLPSTQRRS